MECVGAIVREFVRETLLSMCIEYRYICDNMYVTMHTFMHECVRARLSLYLCLCVCVCVRVYIYRAVVYGRTRCPQSTRRSGAG